MLRVSSKCSKFSCCLLKPGDTFGESICGSYYYYSLSVSRLLPSQTCDKTVFPRVLGFLATELWTEVMYVTLISGMQDSTALSFWHWRWEGKLPITPVTMISRRPVHMYGEKEISHCYFQLRFWKCLLAQHNPFYPGFSWMEPSDRNDRG